FALHRNRRRDALAVPGARPQSPRGRTRVRHQGRHAAATASERNRAGSEKRRRRRSSYRQRMTVTVSSMFITVNDPDEALTFYRDALGLEVRIDVESDGFRWLPGGAPGQNLAIVLSQPHGGRSQTEGDALQALVTQGSM